MKTKTAPMGEKSGPPARAKGAKAVPGGKRQKLRTRKASNKSQSGLDAKKMLLLGNHGSSLSLFTRKPKRFATRANARARWTRRTTKNCSTRPRHAWKRKRSG